MNFIVVANSSLYVLERVQVSLLKRLHSGPHNHAQSVGSVVIGPASVPIKKDPFCGPGLAHLLDLVDPSKPSRLHVS